MTSRIASLVAAAAAFALPALASAEVFNVQGWTITFPANVLTNLNLSGSANYASDRLSFSESSTFLTNDPLVFTFVRNSAAAGTANKIFFEDGTLTNSTPGNWSGYEFSLITPGNVATFNQGQTNGLTISPFTTLAYDPTSTVATFAGGVVQSTNVNPIAFSWQFGNPVGSISINADVPAGTTLTIVQRPVAIPEPAALGMLGLPLALLRRRR